MPTHFAASRPPRPVPQNWRTTTGRPNTIDCPNRNRYSRARSVGGRVSSSLNGAAVSGVGRTSAGCGGEAETGAAETVETDELLVVDVPTGGGSDIQYPPQTPRSRRADSAPVRCTGATLNSSHRRIHLPLG